MCYSAGPKIQAPYLQCVVDYHLCYCKPDCCCQYDPLLIWWDSSQGLYLGLRECPHTSGPCIPLDLKYPNTEAHDPIAGLATSSPGKAGRNRHRVLVMATLCQIVPYRELKNSCVLGHIQLKASASRQPSQQTTMSYQVQPLHIAWSYNVPLLTNIVILVHCDQINFDLIVLSY